MACQTTPAPTGSFHWLTSRGSFYGGSLLFLAILLAPRFRAAYALQFFITPIALGFLSLGLAAIFGVRKHGIDVLIPTAAGIILNGSLALLTMSVHYPGHY